MSTEEFETFVSGLTAEAREVWAQQLEELRPDTAEVEGS